VPFAFIEGHRPVLLGRSSRTQFDHFTQQLARLFMPWVNLAGAA